jgi:integrase
MQLVEIKGISKRKKRPVVLTVEQYYLILALIPQPYRTMVMVAQCTGLRAEEVLALEWEDIDFEKLSMRVVRAVVHGRVKIVKTEYSEDGLPLDPELRWSFWTGSFSPGRRLRPKIQPRLWGWSWSFAATSPGVTITRLPSSRTTSGLRDAAWWSVPSAGAGVGVWCEQVSLTPNGKRLPLHEERREAAGKYDGIGWHTFRHTYRSWLDDTGAPMGVQQKADAASPNLDHDERVRQRADGSQAGSQHQSRQEGTEERITMQRNPQTHPENPSALERRCYLGLIWGWPFG